MQLTDYWSITAAGKQSLGINPNSRILCKRQFQQ